MTWDVVVGVAMVFSLVAPIACSAQTGEPARSGRTYFVDCGSSVQQSDGFTAQAPWTSLAQVNSHEFGPGDVLRFKRGSVCRGNLRPKGSGSSSATTRITAYGTGAMPKIVAEAGSDAALEMFNQQYWDIDSLDLSGGTTYGIHVSGDKGILHHIHLANLHVHDVGSAPMKRKESGLVVISPGSVDQHFDDVLVDGVVAYNTKQWVGILVGGGDFGFPPEETWSTNVTIRNSMVHDVQGDGIVLFRVRDGRITSSVAWNIGMQPTESIGTPNAIWTWMCHDCLVEQNEAFLTDSPGVDGGAFDIDYGNTSNSVLNNYGHDTQGYCIAVFAAGFVTRQSVVRGNTCLNNARSPRMAHFQGAIFVHTWNDGTISGLTIEDNRIYWNPPGTAPAILNDAAFQGEDALVRNNRIYSTSLWMITSNRALHFEANQYALYTQRGESIGKWNYGDGQFRTFADYQAGSGQDRTGSFRRIAAANRSQIFLPETSGGPQQLDLTYRAQLRELSSERKALLISDEHLGGRWTILATLSGEIDASGLLNEESRRQIVFLRSLAAQFHGNGLHTLIKLRKTALTASTKDSLKNVVSDLGFRAGRFVVAQSTGSSALAEPLVLLVSPERHVVKVWRGFVGASELGLAVRERLGDPAFALIGDAEPQN